MFGHNPLTYGNIHTLLHNAETRTFKAATEKPASWTGDYYEIKCRGGGAYRTAFLKSTGEQATSNMGNQTMLDAQKIAHAVAALPEGTYYEVIGSDCMPGSSSGGTSGRSGNGNGDETPAGECLDENREDATDETGCGDCLSGFEEDDTGACVAVSDETEETNWMLYGGVVVALVVGAYFVKPYL
ncbi:hypothetical protein CMK18_21445 [Candidatus Poribacteria bacterium]|nr:hypothetical protein [Candidatus Poribacteria bacterium]